MSLVQLASINYFYSMWQLEDNVFYDSLSLPWGSFQSSCCFVWNKWFEKRPYFNFYLHNTKLKCNGKTKVPKWNSHIPYTKDMERLWPTTLNFWCISFFFINGCKWKVFKILKTSLEACFFWHELMFYHQCEKNHRAHVI